MSRLLERYYDEQEEAQERDSQETTSRGGRRLALPVPVPCLADDISLTCDSYRTGGIGVAEAVIAQNQDWLQHESRTTAHVLETLFPRTMTQHISLDRMLVRVAGALFAAGYTPNDHSYNPTWTFPV